MTEEELTDGAPYEEPKKSEEFYVVVSTGEKIKKVVDDGV